MRHKESRYDIGGNLLWEVEEGEGERDRITFLVEYVVGERAGWERVQAIQGDNKGVEMSFLDWGEERIVDRDCDLHERGSVGVR